MASDEPISLKALQERVDALAAMLKEAYAATPDKDGAVRIQFAAIREHARGIMDIVGDGADTTEATGEDEDMTGASNSPTKVAGLSGAPLSMDAKLRFADYMSGREPGTAPTTFRDFIKPSRRIC
jgi:hypothetical protein